MKILIVRNSPNLLSVKNNTYNIQEVGLAKALVKKGHQCDVLFWTDQKEEDVEILCENHNIRVFYRHGISFLKNCIYTHSFDLMAQYDILQVSEYNQIQSWLLARKYPEKTIVYHGPYYSAFNKRYNLMCKVFDCIFLRDYLKLKTPFIVKSNLALNFLNEKGIHNVVSLGVGIDAQMLGNNETNDFIEQMKCDTSELKLLYIGRIEPRRNTLFLMDVLKSVKEITGRVKLYLIGTGDEAYVSQVKQKIEDLQLKENVVLCSKMEQKYLSSVYQNADVFLLPTSYEIFGMVLLEAMYYGNAVITTRNGGSETLIQHQVNGWIEDELDAQAWKEAILKVCVDQKMKEKAHDTVAQHYTWDCLADGFVSEYQKLMK